MENKKGDKNFYKIRKMRESVADFLKGLTKQHKYVGCSRDFFVKWLNFENESYGLDTYGGFHGWCMDHVIACTKFNMLDEQDLIKCYHWSNVQALTRSENSKKHCYLKKDELDRHLEKLKKFTDQTEIRELILKENIVIPDFDRHAYIDQ